MSGATAGGMLMTLVASHAIARGGWRLGYQVLAAPMFQVAAPLIWLLVRTRPAGDAGVSVAEATNRLPGLEGYAWPCADGRLVATASGRLPANHFTSTSMRIHGWIQH